jgi:thiosulfate reductase cytochrome b subunit
MKFFKIYKQLLKEELFPKYEEKLFNKIFTLIYTAFLWTLLPLTLIALILTTGEEYLKWKKKKED